RARAAPPAARSGHPSSRRRSPTGDSLDGEDSRHRIQGQHVGEQAVDFELAAQQLGRDPSPDPVVVHRQPEQTDLEVAEAHDGVGGGPERESALWLESVVDDQLAALEVERHALVDVGDEDADARDQRIEVAFLLWMSADVGLDQPAEHRRESARLVIRVLDEPATLYVEPYFSSGHSTGTRVVHSVISWDAFV